MAVHEHFAGGGTEVLHVEDDLYLMQRSGFGGQPGLVCVLNNRGDRRSGASVQTRWRNTRFAPVAWDGYDQGAPQPKWTDDARHADFWAAPRGYSIYVPQG
jgi:alpha-amylase